jgi:trehalose/maltose hydrolase-like predicted phosphorylase
MLFYLFSTGEFRSLFERLGYPFDDQTIPENISYYYPRSAHDSSLSRVATPGSWRVRTAPARGMSSRKRW